MDLDEARLEILRIARELVVGEYNNRRAETHNQWLVESDRLWKASRTRLAYPPIPPYPTEADILSRAKTLMEFVGVAPKKSKTIEESEPVIEIAPVIDNEAVTDSAPADEPENDTALPSMLKRIEEMRLRLEDSVGSKNGKD